MLLSRAGVSPVCCNRQLPLLDKSGNRRRSLLSALIGYWGEEGYRPSLLLEES